MRLTRRGVAARSLPGLAALALAMPAQAQGWPARPVTLVVPFVPGGSADVIGRPLAQHLAATLGGSFVIDNRGGANGNVGTAAVARAEPDGHTLLVTTNGPVSTNTLLFKAMPYDPLTALTPIALLSDLPVIVVARRDAPWQDFAALLGFARANPGKLNVGVPATGALGHLAAELLARRAGIDWTIVPFRGGPGAANGLLSGAVDVTVDLVPPYQGQIAAGGVRVLGVALAGPLAAAPGAAPIAAQGVPGFEAAGWTAILGPAGLPGGIVARVNAATNAFLARPETRAMAAAMGSNVLGGAPEALAAKMRTEIAQWQPVIAATGITLD
jgi:tripartite-type tricarboxylate transporter receptor subunit TctC